MTTAELYAVMLGQPLEAYDAETDTWRRAKKGHGVRVVVHGREWTYPAQDVRLPRPRSCTCGDCVACEIADARAPHDRTRRSA